MALILLNKWTHTHMHAYFIDSYSVIYKTIVRLHEGALKWFWLLLAAFYTIV